MNKHYRTLCAAMLLLLLASGCTMEQDRTEKPAPDWSRGLILGQTALRQPVAMAVDATKHAHLVWTDQGLHYVQLDPSAKVLTDERLDINQPNIRRPQLLSAGENGLHLAWLSRQGDTQKLYHATIGPSGDAGPPLLLSREGENVTGFRMYRSPESGVGFVWAGEWAGGNGELFHATLEAPAPALLLAHPTLPLSSPYVVVDNTGTVHVTWLQERGLTSRTIYYATLEGSNADPALTPSEGSKLTDFGFGESAIVHGPVVGLDPETVYVIWSVQNQGGGLTPTSAFSYYVAFAPGVPQVTNPRSIGLPPADRPTYEDYESAYGISKLSLLSPGSTTFGSDFVTAPSAASAQLDELAVTFGLMIQSTAGSEIQLAMAVLSGGEPVGYQLASKTTNASLISTLAADGDGALHVAWIDTAGFRQYQVHYATLAPQARQWLDRTSGDDLAFGAAEIIFGVLSGIGLLPIAGIWSFPPMVWVVVFFIATGKEDMERTATKIGFGIAVALYVGLKVLLLPGLFSATPFLYAVPQSWAMVVGIAVPLAILAVAGLAVYVYTRRAGRATIFVSFLIFAAADVLLTIVLYSPGFFDRS